MFVDLSLCEGASASGDRIIFGRVLPANDDGLYLLEPDALKYGNAEAGDISIQKVGREKGWKVKLQLLRKSDGKMCTIFETDKPYAPDVDYAPEAMRRISRPFSSDSIDIDALKRDHIEAHLNFRHNYTNLAMQGEGLHLLKVISEDLYGPHSEDDEVVGFYFDVHSKLSFPKCPRYFGLEETLREFQNNNPPHSGSPWQNFARFYEKYWENARHDQNLCRLFQEYENETQEMITSFKGIEIIASISIHNGAGSYHGELAGSDESGIRSHGVGFLHLVEKLKGWH